MSRPAPSPSPASAPDWSSYKDSLIAAIESGAQKLPKDQIGFLIGAGVALLLITSASAQLVCTLVGFGYPAYASVKAIHSPSAAEHTRWLAYWTVLGVVSLIDHLTVINSIMRILPVLFLVKAAALVYLYHSKTRGAEHCYANYIAPGVAMAEAWLAQECGGAQA